MKVDKKRGILQVFMCWWNGCQQQASPDFFSPDALLLELYACRRYCLSLGPGMHQFFFSLEAAAAAGWWKKETRTHTHISRVTTSDRMGNTKCKQDQCTHKGTLTLLLVTTAAGFGLLQTIRDSLYSCVGTMRSSANTILFFMHRYAPCVPPFFPSWQWWILFWAALISITIVIHRSMIVGRCMSLCQTYHDMK